MEQNQPKKKVSPQEKLTILFATLAGAGVGSVLGMLAYSQHWLG